MDHSPRWASPAQLQEKYNVDAEWLRALTINGRIRAWHPPPSVKHTNECVLYSETDVQTVLAELTENQVLRGGLTRQEEKALTFGQRYGTSPAKLKKQLSLDLPDVDFAELEKRTLAALKKP